MSEGHSYKPPTPEDIARIDAALEKVQGHRGHAARALGLEEKWVYNVVTNNPHLRAKWVTKVPQVPQPGLASDLHRDPGLEAHGIDEEVIAALDKQDQIVEKKRIYGFDKDERGFFAKITKSYAINLKDTMDFSYAGAVHANGRMLILLEKLNDKLVDIEANPDRYRMYAYSKDGDRYEVKGPNEYYHETAELITRVSGELRKMGASVHQANEMRLRIKKMENANLGVVKRVAGWSSPAAPKEAST